MAYDIPVLFQDNPALSQAVSKAMLAARLKGFPSHGVLFDRFGRQWRICATDGRRATIRSLCGSMEITRSRRVLGRLFFAKLGWLESYKAARNLKSVSPYEAIIMDLLLYGDRMRGRSPRSAYRGALSAMGLLHVPPYNRRTVEAMIQERQFGDVS